MFLLIIFKIRLRVFLGIIKFLRFGICNGWEVLISWEVLFIIELLVILNKVDILIDLFRKLYLYRESIVDYSRMMVGNCK